MSISLYLTVKTFFYCKSRDLLLFLFLLHVIMCLWKGDDLMERANKDIRKLIDVNDLKHWEVAQQAGIADTTLSVWLRTPLNDERRTKVQTAINELINAK